MMIIGGLLGVAIGIFVVFILEKYNLKSSDDFMLLWLPLLCGGILGASGLIIGDFRKRK